MPVNLSKKYLGVLEPHTSVQSDMTLVAFSPGMHLLTGIVLISEKCDDSGGREYNNSGKQKS